MNVFQQQNKFTSAKEMMDRTPQKDLYPAADDDDFIPPSTPKFY
jgi:hypothetical protein